MYVSLRVSPGDIGLRLAGPFSPVRDPLNRASCHAELSGDHAGESYRLI
jgi:hypothetical protein